MNDAGASCFTQDRVNHAAREADVVKTYVSAIIVDQRDFLSSVLQQPKDVQVGRENHVEPQKPFETDRFDTCCDALRLRIAGSEVQDVGDSHDEACGRLLRAPINMESNGPW